VSSVQELPILHECMDTWAPERAGGELERELLEATSAEVRFDSGTRGIYSTDTSNYRQVPLGVVIPRSTQDVIET
jgi:FAD/FMN-containing dehydrogenase